MENELVSIIIPTYNREKTIKKAVNSVLNQTYKNIEVIVIDDGSTDQTEEVIKAIKDTRLKYFKYKQNQGACYARNLGIKKSKGEFITFNDSDDIYQKNKILKQLNNIKEKQSDIDFCKIKIHRNNFEVIIPSEEQEKSIYKDELFNELLNGNFISTQTIFAKKELFVKNTFDESIPRFQDYDLLLRIIPKSKVSYTNEVLVDLYRQKDSISESSNKLLESIKIIMLKNYDLNLEEKSKLYNFLLKCYTNDFKEKEYNNKIFYESTITKIQNEKNKEIEEKNKIIEQLAIEKNNIEIERENLNKLYQMIISSRTWKVRNIVCKIIRVKKGNVRKSENNITNIEKSNKKPKKFCLICNEEVENFYPGGFDLKIFKEHHVIGGGRRLNCICPKCNKIDRERWLYYVIKNETNILNLSGKVLHFAPEESIAHLISQNQNVDYYTCDINPLKGMHVVDITNIQFKDKVFDYVICNHVMEHIKNEKKAVEEIKRVLKKNGKWIFSFPICTDMKTQEESKCLSNEQRVELYGQEDHVRLYGIDFIERFKKYGLNVKIISPRDYFSKEKIGYYGFIPDDKILIATKKNK